MPFDRARTPFSPKSPSCQPGPLSEHRVGGRRVATAPQRRPAIRRCDSIRPAVSVSLSRLWAQPAVCARSSAAHSSALTVRRRGVPAPITTVRREPAAKIDNRCNELPAVVPGVGEVLSVHDCAAIDRKRTSQPNQSGHRAVALQEKRDARRFCALCTSCVECLNGFTRHGRLLPCARPRGIADRRSDKRSRRPRS